MNRKPKPPRLVCFFSIPLLLACAISIFSCKDNGNPIDDGKPPSDTTKPPCPPIEIVPPSPYDSPVWHPGGQFIGFNHTPLKTIHYPYRDTCYGEYEFETDSAGFWLINPDGSNMRRIFPFKLLNPAWSWDGQWIAFTVLVGEEAHIFKMRFSGTTFDTTTVVQLTTEGRNFFPAWSPDGMWIAYDSNSDSPNGMNFIWKMKADGNQKERIAYAPTIGEIRMPHWSPDGNWIVHIRYQAGTFSSEIFTMDTRGSAVVQLTQNNATDYYPKFSPHGTKIAFWSNTNIYLMDTSGTNIQQLTTQGVTTSFGGIPFSWSPTGDEIVYTRWKATDWTMKNGVLWLVDVRSGMEVQLTGNP